MEVVPLAIFYVIPNNSEIRNEYQIETLIWKKMELHFENNPVFGTTFLFHLNYILLCLSTVEY